MKTFTTLVILLSFLISPNLLYIAGTGYSQATGAAYLKIHPLTYILLFSVVLLLMMKKANKALFHTDSFLLKYIGMSIALSMYCVLMGFNVSAAVVTIVTPILFAYCAQRLKRNQLNSLGFWLRLFVSVNAIVGIYENIIGDTILPRVVGDILVQTDQRSWGLVGHPLSSAFLSGAIVLYVLYQLIFTSKRLSSAWMYLIELGINLFGIFVFASRATLIFVLLLSILILFFHRGQNNNKNFWKKIIMFFILIFGGIFLLQSEFAEVALNRFLGDEYADHSTESRLTLFALLTSMSPAEWFTGVSASRRIELQEFFDTTYGLEITWVAWIMSFGIFWTIYLVVQLWKFLFKIYKVKGSSHLYLIVFFLLSMSSSQGLGGKTLTLLWFSAILFCFEGSNEIVEDERLSFIADQNKRFL